MSNIIRRPHEEHPVATTREVDPMRWMRELFRWDPFREMAPSWMTPSEPTFSPAFEVKESRDSFMFKADLPGIKESDLDVKIVGNRLTVAGKREAEHEDKNDTYYTYERSYGSFVRAFTLPEGVDTEHVNAELKEGVLTIAIPKRPTAQAKNIQVKTTEKVKS